MPTVNDYYNKYKNPFDVKEVAAIISNGECAVAAADLRRYNDILQHKYTAKREYQMRARVSEFSQSVNYLFEDIDAQGSDKSADGTATCDNANNARKLDKNVRDLANFYDRNQPCARSLWTEYCRIIRNRLESLNIERLESACLVILSFSHQIEEQTKLPILSFYIELWNLYDNKGLYDCAEKLYGRAAKLNKDYPWVRFRAFRKSLGCKTDKEFTERNDKNYSVFGEGKVIFDSADGELKKIFTDQCKSYNARIRREEDAVRQERERIAAEEAKAEAKKERAKSAFTGCLKFIAASLPLALTIIFIVTNILFLKNVSPYYDFWSAMYVKAVDAKITFSTGRAIAGIVFAFIFAAIQIMFLVLALISIIKNKFDKDWFDAAISHKISSFGVAIGTIVIVAMTIAGGVYCGIAKKGETLYYNGNSNTQECIFYCNGYYFYTENQYRGKTCTVKDIYSNNPGEILVIPDKHKPKSYSENMSVVISDSVLKANHITKIIIRDGAESIGDGAFQGCNGLTSITIPNSVTSIGSNSFYGCSGLTSVTIPNGVTSIGQSAFGGCSGLTSITIPNSVTSIGSNAFSGCSGLTSITIPNSVTSIGSNAFSGCSKLTSVTIPDSVTSIGSNAFSGCNSLENITLPFVGASNGDTRNNFAYVFGNDVPSSLKTVTITSVTSIGNSAFYNCTDLTSITIPEGVKSIGNSAFSGCGGLKSITIPNSVTSIGSSAFSGCSGLTSITIPNSVTSIGSGAFSGCNKITSITIPNSVMSIGSGAFSGCSSLENITLPFVGSSNGDTRNNFGYIFGNDVPSSLKTVTITSVTSIGNSAFYNCTGLISITIPDGVKSIGNSAFYGCSGLKSIEIPNSVTSIGSGAFSGCSSLENITLPFVGERIKTTNDIYQYPFGYIFGTNGYTGGTAVTQSYYGKNTNSTTSDTYYIPTSLKNVTITGGNILYGAFYNCSKLTSITIPRSVTSIGGYAFYNCSKLTSITIPRSVTSIGGYAFYDCSGITSITIPNSVTSIGNSAFCGCNSLTIYCEAASKPSGWSNIWNYSNCKVVWGWRG